MDIYELSPAEFDCPAVKNSYISRGDSGKIVFLDGNETNCAEITSILDENTFLNEYDVVVFGENVPDAQADYAGIMVRPDMLICALVINRGVFEKTGPFNDKLNTLSDYEFLIRASANYSVFFVPVTASVSNSCLHDACSTIAYALRSNLVRLKSDGLLDYVYGQLNQYMDRQGEKASFDEAVESILNDNRLYESIARSTAPFFIISGDDTCHGVLRGFADDLAKELVKQGQAVITTNHRYGEFESFDGFENNIYKAIVGFQCPSLEKDFFKSMNSPKLQFMFDHPGFFPELFNNLPQNFYILYQDEYYAQYLRNYRGVTNALQFPPAGRDAGYYTNEDREYGVVFIGAYAPALKDAAADEFQQEFMDYMIQNPTLTFEKGLENILACKGIAVSKEKFCQILASLHPVCRSVINYYRNAVVEAILKAGIKLDVFGDTWQQYNGPCAENLVLHPAATVDGSLRVWGHSKLGLNVMSWHKAGMTERIANIMLSGAVCISDETTYLRDNFIEDEEIVLFKLDKLEELPGKINRLLEDDALRKQISKKAYEKAKREHTWEKRAHELLELCAEAE
jgi:glycosyltransferase involved in cell wall biosynthesis